ncbi:MAG: hypothetical protein KGJ93_00355, partial [Patescibacteria group bacterium]|nr:hypothetical protein [Patescibacteria group bacterium]
MNKKAIAILGAIFILIVGTLGFLIYAKYGGKQAVPPQAAAPVTSGSQQVSSTPPPAQTASSTPPPSMPPAGQAFMKLIDGPLYSPVIFYNGNGVTYFDAQGQLYQATLQNANNQLQVSDKQPVSGVSPKANL